MRGRDARSSEATIRARINECEHIGKMLDSFGTIRKAGIHRRLDVYYKETNILEWELLKKAFTYSNDETASDVETHIIILSICISRTKTMTDALLLRVGRKIQIGICWHIQTKPSKNKHEP